MKADLSRWTVNKDLGCLKAFIRWLIKRNYHNGKVEINFVKAPQIVHKALTDDEIKVLLKNCPTQTWKMRILLSLCTGLRAGDIDRLEVGQIDLQHATLTSISRKTGKTYQDRPIPFKLVPTLSEYTQKLPENTVKLLPDINIRKTWEAIRLKAGLPDVTRQMFRVTFSVLIQKVGNIKTAQQLLEHYDRKTTEMFYSDESIIRWKIEQLPVKRWLFYCK
jgi:integrase